MTIPYNATEDSSKSTLADALKDKFEGTGIVVSKDDIKMLSKILREAMYQVAPAPLVVMKWIGDVMAECIKDNNDVVSWVTPSGFIVEQKRDKFTTKKIEAALMGRCQMRLIDVIKLDQIKESTDHLVLPILSTLSMPHYYILPSKDSMPRFPSYTTRFCVVVRTWLFCLLLSERLTCISSQRTTT